MKKEVVFSTSWGRLLSSPEKGRGDIELENENRLGRGRKNTRKKGGASTRVSIYLLEGEGIVTCF